MQHQDASQRDRVYKSIDQQGSRSEYKYFEVVPRILVPGFELHVKNKIIPFWLMLASLDWSDAAYYG